MSVKASLTDEASSAVFVPSYNATSSGGTQPEGGDAAEVKKSWIFPLEPFWLFSIALPHQYKFIPSYIRIVHTFSHLVLLVGVIANAVLLFDLLIEWQTWKQRRDKEPLLAIVLCTSSAFALLCLFQLCTELVQYSADIQLKSAEIQKGKEQYEKQFHEMLSQLDTLIGQALDTQAALAERSLDSKRRDFLRFLRAMGPKLSAANGSGPLLQNFRSFIVLWLKMFEESSADPVDRPFVIATEEELQTQCSTAAAVAELVAQRAQAMDVKFIADQVEADKKSNSKARVSWNKMLTLQKKAAKFTGLTRFFKRKDIEAGHLPTSKEYQKQQESQDDQDLHEARWLKFDLVGCGCEVAEEDYFPVSINAMVVSVTILSPEHFRLLISLFLGLGLLVFDMFSLKKPLAAVILLLSVNLVCVMFVLYDFLDIDTIQRLEAQIKELQAANERVEERRTKMLAFFDRVHLLADFWLHRTLPRLELAKRLGEELEDAKDVDLVPALAEVVVHMGSIEQSLLPVERWLKPMSKDSKNRLSSTLNELSARGSLREILDATPQAVQELSERKKKLLSEA
eukprot:gb/GFBE01058630.1/.p1 GENE.gb/GFBE01058630.1/~~gb/GFBE01058630.1/.p1  ORF type:complete len:568 (+),score=148.22 gb/GFBE01058630.1/:1-1704(+)